MTTALPVRPTRMVRIFNFGQLLAGLAGLFLVGGTLLSYQFLTLRQGLQADVGIHARMLAENISAPLMFGDREAANDVLHALLADPVLVDAVVHDAQGREFAAFHRDTTPAGFLESLAPQWFGPASIRHPIVYRGRTLGSALLRAETGAIDTALRNYTALFGLSWFAALLASAFLSRRSRVRVALAEAELAHLAYTDPVTDLPNRRGGQKALDAALRQARARGERVGLILIDLDNFKFVNDSAGHAAGDLLLRRVGDRLRAAARGSDVVSRFGGDEFIVIVAPLASSAQLTTVAAALMDGLRDPVQIDGAEVAVTASAGACVFPNDAASAEELICHADAALYDAKGDGRNRVSAFHPDMIRATQRRAQLERDLRRAIDCGGLTVVYQPQFAIGSGALVGAEALLRWQHPEHGHVGPDEFIPIAEDTGLIVEIGSWVLERACTDIAALDRLGGAHLQIAVNVSARQFREPDFAHRVERILSRTGLAPARLELELTESVLMKDRSAAIGFMRAMRALGVRLSIDDFGTGYSSLSYLQSFPIDQLKIDRSFVRPLPAEGQVLVNAVIGLAHGFGLTVVAEGVEDEAQLAWLEQAGCDYVQGYLLGRPMPLAALQAQIRLAGAVASGALARHASAIPAEAGSE